MPLPMLSAPRSLIFAAALLLSAPSVLAASLTFVFTETMTGVQVSASGAIETSGLPAPSTLNTIPVLSPGLPALAVGPTAAVNARVYFEAFEMPFDGYGTGSMASVTSGSGDRIGLTVGSLDKSVLILPAAYQSGSALAGDAFFAGRSFQSLGLTPGVVVYTLVNDQTVTLQIGDSPTPVPLPASVLLLLPALAALVAVSRVKA